MITKEDHFIQTVIFQIQSQIKITMKIEQSKINQFIIQSTTIKEESMAETSKISTVATSNLINRSLITVDTMQSTLEIMIITTLTMIISTTQKLSQEEEVKEIKLIHITIKKLSFQETMILKDIQRLIIIKINILEMMKKINIMLIGKTLQIPIELLHIIEITTNINTTISKLLETQIGNHQYLM